MGKLLHKRIDYTGVSPYEFVPIKEADYNALTPAEQEDETKLYWLYDADTVSADIDDESVSSGKVWSSEKVSSEISDVQDQVDTNTDDISTLNSALTVNIIGSPTTLSSTPYVFPSDGYVICSARGTDGFSAAEIKDANGVLFASPSISGTSMANTFQIVTYVKKGMSAIGAKSGASSANNVTFVPLTTN